MGELKSEIDFKQKPVSKKVLNQKHVIYQSEVIHIIMYQYITNMFIMRAYHRVLKTRDPRIPDHSTS